MMSAVHIVEEVLLPSLVLALMRSEQPSNRDAGYVLITGCIQLLCLSVCPGLSSRGPILTIVMLAAMAAPVAMEICSIMILKICIYWYKRLLVGDLICSNP